jgi:hypothetical protein
MPNFLRTTIIVIVAVVWAVNFTAPIFVKDYKPTPELNVAFMAIMGVLTASYNRNERKPPPGRHTSKKSGDTGEKDDEREDAPEK